MKRILLLGLCCALLLIAIACNTPEIPNPDNSPSGPDTKNDVDLSTCYTTAHPPSAEATCYVQFKLVGGATFVVELYPEQAPQTVAHFQKLVANHYYDGLTFHRIWKDYCVYDGDPTASGTGCAINPIPGEFKNNGFEGNTLQHLRGTISMWHSSTDPDSATTQFFIMQKDSVTCDGKYAAFGRVIYGMETVDAIANVPLTEEQPSNNKTKPVKAPVIESATFVIIEAAAE